MKKSSFAILSMLALTGSVFGQSAADFLGVASGAPGSHQLSHQGGLQNLTLCTHEICFLDEAGKLQIEPVAAGSMAAIISQASIPDGHKYLVFYPAGQERNPSQRRILRNRYVVKLAEGADPELVRERCGIKSMKLMFADSRLAICEEESAGKALGQLSNVLRDPEVVAAEPLFARKRNKRLVPTDPFYNTVDNPRDDEAYQWYFNNEGVNGGVPNVDINLEPALDFATGEDVLVAIVDDGLAIDHEDLAANVTGPHLNLLDGAPDDPATLDADLVHGTQVAGILGAVLGNDLGITGAAPDVSLSGIRLLGDFLDDGQEAQALSFSNGEISIYNNSWGPPDDTYAFERPGLLLSQAFEDGVNNGRLSDPDDEDSDPLGNIFVWAAGNGGEIGDQSNFDGYANSKYTIAVGAIDDGGTRAPYSERGANLVVVAPSGGGAQDVLTTSYSIGVDQDDNPIRVSEYDPDFSGTSAAVPMVSGVVALMLEENPDLTWRDVQDVLIRTARKIDPGSGEWITNGAGIDFNQNYGSGLVDAAAAVAAANNVSPETALGPVERHSKFRFFFEGGADTAQDGTIPNNNGQSLQVSFDMSTDEEGNDLPNLRVEHVELSATVITEKRGDLEIVLISPNGTESVLHAPDANIEGESILRWSFMTVRNWGEGSSGNWIVRITDSVSTNPAILNNLSLVINGTPDPDAPIGNSPLLTSNRFIQTDQGSPFSYSIETVGADSITLGDLPPGFQYNAETQVISGTPTQPGLFNVPIVLGSETSEDGSFTLTFVVRPTAVALGDAIGLPDRPAVFGGDAPWDFELLDTNDVDGDEVSAARSAINLGDDQRSVFGFDGFPRGVLLFDWKVSSEEGFDRLWFNRGGRIPQSWDAFISGERQWARSAVFLPERRNDVRWIYSKDGSVSDGEDRGIVDNVEFMTMEKYREEIIKAANIEGFDVEINSRAGFIPTDLDGASPPEGGSVPTSIITPSIGNGQQAAISGWVEGPGEFSFIAINYAEASDVLEFLIDGVVISTKQGAGPLGDATDGLFAETRRISDGRHRIELRFRKDFSGSAAAVWDKVGVPFDGAIFDDLKFVPDSNFSNFVSQYGPGVDLDPNADYDQDGYSNHEEYAFGGNMIVADVPRHLPRLVELGDDSYIEFGLDTSREDLKYTPQQSKDLENWEDAELVTLDRSEGDVEIYRIPVASGPGRRHLFYRVVAEAK